MAKIATGNFAKEVISFENGVRVVQRNQIWNDSPIARVWVIIPRSIMKEERKKHHSDIDIANQYFQFHPAQDMGFDESWVSYPYIAKITKRHVVVTQAWSHGF